jgi:WD40 repeat protein
VVLWEVSDPARPRRLGDPLTGHTGGVTAVAFAPDGHTLATASADETVLLWDVSDPAQPRRLGDPLTGHTHAVTAVAFAPDGHTLATASTETVLWDFTGLNELHADPLGRACSVTGHGLTVDEWGRFVPDLAYADACPQ